MYVEPDNIIPLRRHPAFRAPGIGPDPDAGPEPGYYGGCKIVPRRTGRSLLTPDQRAAVAAIDAFIANPVRPLFVLHGASGSGLSHIRRAYEPWVRFTKLRTCMSGAVAAREAEIPALGRLIHPPGRWLQDHVVVLDDAGTARRADVMVLRRKGARLVALVDPDRLPPVHGTAPEFRHPDFVLREIHPMALADPIRAQARTVLLGGDYFDDGHTVRVKKTGNREDLLAADIVICGRYETLQRLNQRARLARDFIKGPVPGDGVFDPRSDYPRKGDSVLVRRSDELPRGEIATLWEPFPPGSTNAIMLVHDGNGGLAELTRVRFGGMPCPLPERAILDEIDFGYVILALEIQGARWEHVLLIDEMRPSDPLRPAWLYTAFAAAEKSITILRKYNS